MSAATVVRSERRQGWVSSGTFRYDYVVSELSCGHWTVEAPVGSVVACEHCSRDADARAEIQRAHDEGRIQHTRAGDRLMRDSILVYARCPESPTGVTLLTTISDRPENVDFIRSLSRSYSPLSPTEGRGR